MHRVMDWHSASQYFEHLGQSKHLDTFQLRDFHNYPVSNSKCHSYHYCIAYANPKLRINHPKQKGLIQFSVFGEGKQLEDSLE